MSTKAQGHSITDASKIYFARCEQDERERLEREHNVIRNIFELVSHGWCVVSLEPWGAKRVRYTAIRCADGRAERKIGFAARDVFDGFQL